MAKKKKLKSAERKEAVAQIILGAQKLLGKGSLQTLRGEFSSNSNQKGFFTTSSIGLDYILGGGIPKGRIIEIYGPEAGGKTTLTLHIISHIQKAGKFAAFIDAEHAMSIEYAGDIGVNLEELLFTQPDSGESVFELVEYLLQKKDIGVIVIDSVAALIPRAELSADMDSLQPGQQARMMSKALRRVTTMLGHSETSIIFINQLRMKIGGYGNPETTPGGVALKFYASVRIDIRRIGSIKQGEKILGNRVKCKIVKNKVAPPFRQAEFDLIFGEGISTLNEVLDYSLASGEVSRAGSWYSYNRGEELIRAQGREAILDLLKEEDPKLLADLKKSALTYLKTK